MRLLILNENVSQLNYIKKHIGNIGVSDKNLDKIVTMLYDVDPTSNKKYVKWLIKQFKSGHVFFDFVEELKPSNPQFRLPEDTPKVREVLETYDRFKARIPTQYRDLMKLDFYSLDDIIDTYASTGKSSYIPMDKNGPDGSELIYSSGNYKVFVVRKLSGDESDEVKVKALETLGIGTKWCTRADYNVGGGGSMADHYLYYADVYTVYKNNKPYIQFDTDSLQVMDVNDHKISIKDDRQLANILIDTIPTTDAGVAYIKYVNFGDVTEENYNTIKNDAVHALKYVLNITGKRWPEAEPYIMKDASAAFSYAFNIIGDRWLEAEPYIMKHPHAAYNYAKTLMKSRWPEAEPYIMKNISAAYWYARDVLRKRWPEAEPYIMKSKDYWPKYIKLFPSAQRNTQKKSIFDLFKFRRS